MSKFWDKVKDAVEVKDTGVNVKLFKLLPFLDLQINEEKVGKTVAGVVKAYKAEMGDE